MAIGLGLGFEFGLTAVSFAVIYAAAATKGSYLYQMVGKYGFMLTTLLAIFQTNIDAAAATPISMGLAFMLLIAFLMFFLIIDIAFFIWVIVPRRKNGQNWKTIMFGNMGGY
jgi:hypothetical protein